MQIDGEDIENLLMNIVLEKKNLKKKHRFEKTHFHASSLMNGSKHIIGWNLIKQTIMGFYNDPN
jgi:hypothetical protein